MNENINSVPLTPFPSLSPSRILPPPFKFSLQILFSICPYNSRISLALNPRLDILVSKLAIPGKEIVLVRIEGVDRIAVKL